MKNLEQFNLVALDAAELQEVQEGVPAILVVAGGAFLAAAAAELGKRAVQTVWDWIF